MGPSACPAVRGGDFCRPRTRWCWWRGHWLEAARPPAEAQTGTEQSSQCACFTCSCVGAMVATCPPSASSHSRGHGICVAAAACARSGVWPQWYVPRARVHQVYAAGRGDPDLSARSAPSTSSISLWSCDWPADRPVLDSSTAVASMHMGSDGPRVTCTHTLIRFLSLVGPPALPLPTHCLYYSVCLTPVP